MGSNTAAPEVGSGPRGFRTVELYIILRFVLGIYHLVPSYLQLFVGYAEHHPKDLQVILVKYSGVDLFFLSDPCLLAEEIRHWLFIPGFSVTQARLPPRLVCYRIFAKDMADYAKIFREYVLGKTYFMYSDI